MGILVIRALLFGVLCMAPDFLEIPIGATVNMMVVGPNLGWTWYSMRSMLGS